MKKNMDKGTKWEKLRQAGLSLLYATFRVDLLYDPIKYHLKYF